jgi:hypothetical protein
VKRCFFVFFIIFLSVITIYAQGFNGYSWGTTKNLILVNEGKADFDNTIGKYEAVLEYNNKIIIGYYTTIIYIFVNNKLYLGNYLFDYLTTKRALNAYNEIYNKLLLLYGEPSQKELIKNEILDKNKHQYTILWNYNEQIIKLKLTYGVTDQWRVSLEYFISPELALIVSGGKIKDYVYGEL